MLMPFLRFIHWKAEETEERADRLRELGYSVAASPFDPSSARNLKVNLPAAFVIDLERLPSHGREVGVMLRMAKPTRLIPLVFVGGEAEKISRVRDVLPDATFCTWETVGAMLAQVLAAPVEKVHVPGSVFDTYAGTPLPKKLGVRPGMRLGLIGAPVGFEQLLGDLPDKSSVQRDNLTDCRVVVWFVTQQAQFDQELPGVLVLLEPGASLWVAWPKQRSAITSNLTQLLVRKAGLAMGWVDYKVCAIDDTWTGLCFKKRK
jgi:hypothetical protein